MRCPAYICGYAASYAMNAVMLPLLGCDVEHRGPRDTHFGCYGIRGSSRQFASLNGIVVDSARPASAFDVSATRHCSANGGAFQIGLMLPQGGRFRLSAIRKVVLMRIK
jgi:hypothetical protein